jgi:hypothetical protein
MAWVEASDRVFDAPGGKRLTDDCRLFLQFRYEPGSQGIQLTDGFTNPVLARSMLTRAAIPGTGAKPVPVGSACTHALGGNHELHLRRDGVRTSMSRFDQDTSVMRARREGTLIELLKPELSPQSKARGILHGVVLGALLWAALITLGIAIWHRLSS